MADRLKVSILLQGLALLLFGPPCQASSLGMTVHVVPLDSDGGTAVQAHFSAIAPSPCPALSGLCAEGEDCLVYPTSLPISGTKPEPGWCVRQWQKTVPYNYNATINLGPNTEFYISMKTPPMVRANSGRLNRPAYVALPPPLRARVNCPHHFHLSVQDLDGDRVRCRFARPDQNECLSCTQHSFLKLDEKKCMLTFTGKASAGQYFIYLMVEDLIPVPKTHQILVNKPLSSVPVHLSLTVEESTSSCTDEPVATDETPKHSSMLFVLPYQEVKFSVNFMSQLESVLEVAVVGPPDLYRVGFKSVGPLATMTVAWIRSENKLAHLLPICFAVNTKSLQSEPRCVWLYQREIGTLPAGTELKCEKTEMTLLLPVASLSDINLAELQLNSPTCPVTYNNTHLTAHISLDSCGTRTVHSGSELVYTNTLQSVRPYTMVSRQPSLILPLACRIQGVQVKGPQYKINLPTETETFGYVRYWIELHFPGEGPMSKFTRTPRFRFHRTAAERVRRDAESPSESNSISSNSTNGNILNTTNGSRIKQLDLYVMSNTSIDRAEMLVSSCIESETEDFAESHPFLKEGCTTSNSTLEIITTNTSSKVYRLDMTSMEAKGSTMYIRCTVNLCIATKSSDKCPDLCAHTRAQRTLVGSVFSQTYTITSGPISMVVTAPTPATLVTTTPLTTKTPTKSMTQSNGNSHVQTSAMAPGVILTTICTLLQNTLFH